MTASSSEIFILRLQRVCRTDILAYALDPAVPYVWVRGHRPMEANGWRETQVALSTSGALRDVQVRGLTFDLQLPTVRFLEVLPDFVHHGIALFQMTRQVPASFDPYGMPDSTLDRLLIQNGLHLSFHLPHAMETAQFRSPHREVLDRLREVSQIKELL